ncbi:MAG: Hsp70 family protein, partial [Gammaproteobacteria bacterium]
FDIDANGILHVSATDKKTGKEQKIVITASSGLAEDEIQRMVSEAEAHAEDDKKFRELVDARNQAETMIHATEKTLEDLGDKVEAEERGSIESAISDVREALKGDNKDVLETKSKALAELSGSLAQRLYAEEPEGGEGAPTGDAGGGDDVVDAEFEEVNENK